MPEVGLHARPTKEVSEESLLQWKSVVLLLHVSSIYLTKYLSHLPVSQLTRWVIRHPVSILAADVFNPDMTSAFPQIKVIGKGQRPVERFNCALPAESVDQP